MGINFPKRTPKWLIAAVHATERELLREREMKDYYQSRAEALWAEIAQLRGDIAQVISGHTTKEKKNG